MGCILCPTFPFALQSLIPDIKVNQEAVVELHPEELQLSGDEESPEAGRDDQDKIKIRRTVTQVRAGSPRHVEGPPQFGICLPRMLFDRHDSIALPGGPER